MALIKFGGGITEMRGSIGGTTFSRNRFGAIARNRTKPVNPNTARQQVVKAALTLLTQQWSNVLSGAQRTAWNLYGSSVAMLNKLGETVYLTGFNHFIRSNSIYRAHAINQVNLGPTVFELPAADPTISITASEATQAFTLTFDDQLDWAAEANAYLHVFEGKPQTGQRNFFAGPWRYIGSHVGCADPLPAMPLVFPTQWGIAEGQHSWIYCRISRADARLSQPFRTDALTDA